MRPFVFRHAWSLESDPDLVVDRLVDPAGYPDWWPQIRSAHRLDDDSARVRIRSALPVTLEVVMTREREDRRHGIFRVRLAGDLEGWAQAEMRPARYEGGQPGVGQTGVEQSGVRVVWEQETVMARRGLRMLSDLGPVRAVMRANHAWMMRSAGRALDGLRRREQG